MPIHGTFFAKKSRENITELLGQDKNQDRLREEVGKILMQVYYNSGKEEANKIVEDLNLTMLLKIYPIEDK